MNKLFLAIEPSPHVRTLLAEYVPKVQEKLSRQGMRWVSPEKWHVTLGFIGDELSQVVIDSIQELLESHAEFELSLSGISGFPDLKRPGVLFLHVVSDNISTLRTAVEGVCVPNDGEFTPHLTLSRMKPASTKLGHKLRDFIHSGAKIEGAEWLASEVVLFNSLPDGSYEALHRFKLNQQ
jgi:2'-5' RNA ligase